MKKLPTLKSTIKAYILAAESINLSKRTQAIQITKIFADHSIHIDMIEHDIYAPVPKQIAIHVVPTAIGSPGKHIDKQANRKALTKTATQLLKDSHTTLSSKKFNSLMIAQGMMIDEVRPYKKTVKYPRRYKVLINDGLKFGINEGLSATNSESYPKFYTESFDDLLKIVLKSSSI